MTDTSLRDWPPNPSDLRLACEECHKRKIRCQDGGEGLCQACRLNNRVCLFSLRSKTGRPRKIRLASPQQQQPQHLYRAASKNLSLSLSPRPLNPPAGAKLHPGPDSPSAVAAAAAVTAGHARSYDFERDSATKQPRRLQPSMEASCYADHVLSDASTVDPVETAHVGQFSWLPALATDPGGAFGPILNSPRLGQLVDDLMLETPSEAAIVAPTTQSVPSSVLTHNEQPGHQIGLWKTPSTMDPSDGESSRDSAQTGTWTGNSVADALGGVVPGGNNGDFFTTMRLCSELNGLHENVALDVMARSDERNLAVIIGSIEELGQKTAAALRVAAAEAGAGDPRSRQKHYNWMLTRVAVMGAVDIVSDLVMHNLSIHEIPQPPLAANKSGMDAELILDAGTSDSPGLGMTMEMDTNTDTGTRARPDSPHSVLSLVRLDYAMLQFALFLAADGCDADVCPGAGSWGGGGGDKVAVSPGHRCPKSRQSPTLARAAQIRAQLWALAQRIRSQW